MTETARPYNGRMEIFMQNVAILGFGTVGSGVAQVLTENAEKMTASAGQEIKLKYIVAVSYTHLRGVLNKFGDFFVVCLKIYSRGKTYYVIFQDNWFLVFCNINQVGGYAIGHRLGNLSGVAVMS